MGVACPPSARQNYQLNARYNYQVILHTCASCSNSKGIFWKHSSLRVEFAGQRR